MKGYPKHADFKWMGDKIALYAQLKHEHGAKGIERILAKTKKTMTKLVREMEALKVDDKQAALEPDTLPAIHKLRPKGPRRIWAGLDVSNYRDRVEGALLGRFAGCTLGAPVEGWEVKNMALLAKENHQAFPPKEYWLKVPHMLRKRCEDNTYAMYTRDGMNGVPMDDDVTYTLLGLLVVEDYGPGFTVADNGRAWMKYLPFACTAEKVALANLKDGVPAMKVGIKHNPYTEWIGADIRSDPWGYMAPGWPEKATEMAWRDAYISHRRNGIYGEMYFSAVIAAAFAVNDPVEALRIGLTEIPANCAMADAVRWALRTAPRIRNYKQAREAVDRKFPGMHKVHTLNNACLTILGIAIGKTDFSRVIGETVAMGLDNDCTAATAGSIVGAVVGRKGIPARWTRGFNGIVRSYIIGKPRFRLDDLVRRFTKQAARVHES